MSKAADPGLAEAQALLDQGKAVAAVRLVRQLLGAHPTDPAVWAFAGRCFLGAGQPRAAAEAFARATAITPQAHHAWSGLSRAARQLGDMGVAVHAARKAATAHPENARYQAILGDLLFRVGHLDYAERRLHRATTLDPSLVVAWLNLAIVRAAQQDSDGALTALAGAQAAAPQRLVVWLRTAEVHLAIGQLAQAEAAVDRAAALAPAHPRVLMIRGSLLERHGHHKRAAAVLEPLVRTNETTIEATTAWARACRRLGRAADAVPQLLARSRQPLRPLEAQRLFHTLGELHEATGARSAAVAAHQRGNRARLADPDIASLPRELAHTARRFCSPTTPQADPVPGMVFIVGMPRSGTSLVEQILACHPQVQAGGELNSLRDAIAAHAPPNTPWSPAAAASVRGAYLADASARTGVDPAHLVQGSLRLTDKQPGNFAQLGVIHEALPGARIVHCVRDPLDVGWSCFRQNFGPGHVWSTELEWIGLTWRAYRSVMNHWTQVCEIDAIDVVYEELVHDPEPVVRTLLDRLDLPWHPGCLDFHRSGRTVRTASYDQVRQPLYTSSAGGAQAYRPWLGPLVDALGDTDSLPPATELDREPASAGSPTTTG